MYKLFYFQTGHIINSSRDNKITTDDQRERGI